MGDYGPTAEIRRRNLKRAGLTESQGEATFVIEDNLAVLRMYREAGVAPIAAPAYWERLSRLLQGRPQLRLWLHAPGVMKSSGRA